MGGNGFDDECYGIDVEVVYYLIDLYGLEVDYVFVDDGCDMMLLCLSDSDDFCWVICFWVDEVCYVDDFKDYVVDLMVVVMFYGFDVVM